MENINAVATEEDEYGIRAIMGDRFEDISKMQKPVTIKQEKVPMAKFTPVGKQEKITPAFSRDKAAWAKRGGYLINLLCGGVANWGFFMWQEKGLMASSVATPCMWLAMAIVGFNICRVVMSLEWEA